MKFFNALNFTSANEDGNSELAALCATPRQRIVCLTGSGARVLDLLLGDPQEVIALDMNPAQNQLLRLKIAAYKVLDDGQLLAFLGVTECCDRAALFARVRTELSPENAAFWADKTALISGGIYYAGLWERVLRLGARGTRMLRRANIDQLFAAATLKEQAQIWHDKFDDFWWRGAIRLLGRRWFWTHVIGEPGGQFLPAPRDIEARLAGAFDRAAASQFFRDSDFASLILRGRHEPSQALPLHLAARNMAVVRKRLDRIHIVNGGLTDLAAQGIADVDGFSLSDFGSYCDQQSYDACWRAVIAAAQPDAYFCEREFLNPIRTTLPDIHIDEAFSAQLTHQDNSFIYLIRAGTLK